MDTRADFQRLLEEMDNVIKAKRQELSELDERLDTARKQLTDKEAEELKTYELMADSSGRPSNDASSTQQVEYIQEQKALYELQLERFSEELGELELINRKLAKENDSLRSDLDKREELIDRLQSKCKLLTGDLEEVHSANLELNLRLASAESEVQMQQRLLRKSHEEDEVLMAAFNEKLENLNKAIEWRDAEIKRLKADNQIALNQFGFNMGSAGEQDQELETFHLSGNQQDSDNKRRVIEIARAFREKDTHIELLKSQLLQATKDLERNAVIIENLHRHKLNQKQTGNLDMNDEYASLIGCDPTTRTKYESELTSRLKSLENELEVKDRQVNALEIRNYHYESILPARISSLVHELTSSSKLILDDTQSAKRIEELCDNLNRVLDELNTGQVLLSEIDDLKRLNEEKCSKIALLVQQLNQLGAKSISFQQQTISPSEMLELPISDLGVRETNAENQLNLSDPDTQGQVIKPELHTNLEGRKRDRLREQASVSVRDDEASLRESNTDITGNSDDVKEIEQPIDTQSGDKVNSLAADVSAEMPDSKSSTNSQSESAREQLSVKTRTRFGVSTFITTDAIDNVLKLKSRLRQVESENELLELAMKEILMSIRWSDAQCSTVLIDCPSLERLCQLIEARFLAKSIPLSLRDNDNQQEIEALPAPSDESRWCGEGGLFQMIVLKSELDLLRGQNEQLRADIKTQRREYQQLLLSSACKTHPEQAHEEVDIEIGDELEKGQDSTPEGHDAECQTELDLEDKNPEIVSEDQSESMVVSFGANQKKEVDDLGRKCHNCARLIRLAGHLLQCIVRVENRVFVSEETFMSRLISLNNLIQVLNRDMVIREDLLNNSRRECHLLRQERCLAEARLHFLEVQMSVHSKTCPSSYMSRDGKSATNMKVYTTTKNGNGDSTESVTISKTRTGFGRNSDHDHQVEIPQLKNARMTITLLQSIINCLQARLEYKDERLRYLEDLLSNVAESESNLAQQVRD